MTFTKILQNMTLNKKSEELFINNKRSDTLMSDPRMISFQIILRLPQELDQSNP